MDSRKLEIEKLKERIAELEEKTARTEAVEDHIRSTFDRDNVIKLLIDPDSGKIVDANKSACKFYGYKKESFLQRTILDLNKLPENIVIDRMKSAVNYKANYFTFKHQLANGEFRDVSVHSSPIVLNGKKLLYSIIHDITDQTKLEQKLQESLEFTETILKSSSVGLAFAKDRKIIWAMRPWKKCLAIPVMNMKVKAPVCFIQQKRNTKG